MADAKGAAGERREQQISLRLPAGALEAVDRARAEGLFPRSRSEWLRDAIAAYLGSRSAREQPRDRGQGLG